MKRFFGSHGGRVLLEIALHQGAGQSHAPQLIRGLQDLDSHPVMIMTHGPFTSMMYPLQNESFKKQKQLKLGSVSLPHDFPISNGSNSHW